MLAEDVAGVADVTGVGRYTIVVVVSVSVTTLVLQIVDVTVLLITV